MKCGACGREQSVGGLFCQYCGAGLSASAATLPGTAVAGPCVCGRRLTPQDLFCPACGRARGSVSSTGSGIGGGVGLPSSGLPWAAGGYQQNPVLPPAGSHPQSSYSQSGFPPQPTGYGPSYLPVPVPPAQPLYPYRRKDKVAAGVLALLLGAFGAHKFYLGQPWMGVLYLLLCLTPIPWIAGLVEGITYLAQSDESFDARFNSRY